MKRYPMTKFFYKTYKNWKNTATNNCNIYHLKTASLDKFDNLTKYSTH